jgi:hypothetical protein
MASESKTTTDHKTIQAWSEARGGKPSTVKSTEKDGEAGVLRIDFPGYSGAGSLEEISWDEFFKKFDENKLAFLYQEHTSSGEESRFFKLVSRDSAEHKAHTSSHTTHDTATSDKKEDTKESKAAHTSTAHKSDKKEDTKESKTHASTAHKSDDKESKASASHKSDKKEDAKESKTHASTAHKSDKKEDAKESKAHK